MKATSLLTLVVTIVVVLVNFQNINVVEGKWKWSQCKYSENTTSLACNSIKVIDDSSKTLVKIFPNYVVLRYFWDTKERELCNSTRIQSYMSRKGALSCESYFCHKGIKLKPNATSSEIQKHAAVLNYCQYCQRSDFQSFHAKVAAEECPAFSFADSRFCSPSNHDGYPIYYPPLMAQKYRSPYICNCPYHSSTNARYAHKCDFFSFYILPLSHEVYPVLMLVIASSFLIFSFLFYLLPFLVVRITAVIKSRHSRLKEIYEMFDTYLLITLFIEFHFIMEVIEMTFTLPKMNINRIAKERRLVGFFQALGYIAFLCAMSTLITLWINVLYKTKNKENEAGMIFRLKFVLLVIYLTVGSLAVVPFVSLARGIKPKFSIVNGVFFPVCVVAATALGLGFAIYGVRLFLKIRETTKMNMFKLKFNRFMIAATSLHLLFAVQMVFTSIELFRGGTTFGIVYRYVNLPLLFLTLMGLDAAFLYQTFRKAMIVEAFPFMSYVFSALDVTKCLSYIRKKLIHDDEKDLQNFYYLNMGPKEDSQAM